MYKMIIVPIDLEHADQLAKALSVSAGLAKHYGARLCAVGVTGSAPSSVAHNPAEFAQKFEEFAKQQSAQHGITFETKALTSPDPAVDLDDVLRKVISETNADLVVMASHVPGFKEHFIGSNAGYLASHSDISVFVVR